MYKKLLNFILNNIILLMVLPILTILTFVIIKQQIPQILTFIIFIYGMLLYGIGRAVGQGIYFQIKDNKDIPEQLIDEIKSSKYHTFTLVQAFGGFIHSINLYFSNISIQLFIYMCITAFIFYYFSYGRIYNYIRGRQWYFKNSNYQIYLFGNTVWLSYPTRNLSLILTIVSIIIGILIIIV